MTLSTPYARHVPHVDCFTLRINCCRAVQWMSDWVHWCYTWSIRRKHRTSATPAKAQFPATASSSWSSTTFNVGIFISCSWIFISWYWIGHSYNCQICSGEKEVPGIKSTFLPPPPAPSLLISLPLLLSLASPPIFSTSPAVKQPRVVGGGVVCNT